MHKPNILLVMVDQLTPGALPIHGHPLVQAPNLERLADRAVVFDNAYCASPLCAPSRSSMLAGQLPSRIGAYDNAAEFAAHTPTVAHYLRRAGYQSCLIGKMHFVGPDQLHGFEQRLTTDIYPADFGWTPDWLNPEQRVDWWYHNLSSVLEAGTAELTNQLEFDDENGFRAVHKLRDLARGRDPRPFFLCVSFTHPHDPYVARPQHWDLYREEDIDLPQIEALEVSELDPHSRRLHHVCALGEYQLDEHQIRNARRAYYANISYLDEWLGRMLETLDATGQRDDTLIVFTSDHGDMLGERGLWYKMSFFEPSVRVPLLIAGPRGRFGARRVADNVSLLDMLPTLVELGGAQPSEYALPGDGRSLVPLLEGAREPGREVAGEYLAEGTPAPLLMLKRGQWKYVQCEGDPPQLYDLGEDPLELNNLAPEPAHAATLAAFERDAGARWDSARISDAVIADQQRRLMIFEALRQGALSAWDFEPRRDAASAYMRNHLDLTELERSARVPSGPADSR